MSEQMRKDFEEFASLWRYDLLIDENNFYVSAFTQRVWDSWSSAWQASRAAIVVQLPQELKFPNVTKKLVYVTQIKQAIARAGVRYK